MLMRITRSRMRAIASRIYNADNDVPSSNRVSQTRSPRPVSTAKHRLGRTQTKIERTSVGHGCQCLQRLEDLMRFFLEAPSTRLR